MQEPRDVELFDGPAQDRRGRQSAVNDRGRDRLDDRLGDPRQTGLVESLWKKLGHLGQAALAVETVDGVEQACPQCGGHARIERTTLGEPEDEAFAGDAEPARGAVEAEQDDLSRERFELWLDRRDWARGARIGRPALALSDRSRP